MLKKSHSMFKYAVVAVVLAIVLYGCGNQTPPATPTLPPVAMVVNPKIENLTAGQTVAISVETSGQGLNFKWSVIRGSLSASDTPSVIYTAPSTSGVDTVTVEVSSVSGTVTKSVSFNVIVPVTDTPIQTAVPTDTPTLTPVPEPIACIHPSVTKNLFPKLADVKGQFPIYGPENDPNFLCKAVYDITHSLGKMAIHIKYENVGTNSGWWGIAIKSPDSYDASQYRQMCFWAYAQKPNQSFRVKMKDNTPKESGDIRTIDAANEWTQICTDISRFKELGIKVDKMDNINLGFEQPTDSAEIWVADFEFK